MLYAVIMRFDSLREISTSLQAEARKLCHLGISMMTSRSTLSDANKRRPDVVFEAIYRDLYATYHTRLSSDSRSDKEPKWMKQLQIIDSTTISLFSNLLFKGVGRHPKTGKKKGGIKVHTVIHANEGVPSDIKFTSAATNDSFMLRPAVLNDTMYQTPNGLMEVRIQHVCFTKHLKEKDIIHYSRIITYVDEKKNLFHCFPTTWNLSPLKS